MSNSAFPTTMAKRVRLSKLWRLPLCQATTNLRHGICINALPVTGRHHWHPVLFFRQRSSNWQFGFLQFTCLLNPKGASNLYIWQDPLVSLQMQHIVCVISCNMWWSYATTSKPSAAGFKLMTLILVENVMVANEAVEQKVKLLSSLRLWQITKVIQSQWGSVSSLVLIKMTYQVGPKAIFSQVLPSYLMDSIAFLRSKTPGAIIMWSSRATLQKASGTQISSGLIRWLEMLKTQSMVHIMQ